MTENDEEQNTKTIKEVTRACKELTLPWVKAGMTLPRTSALELARMTRLPISEVMKVINAGSVVLNGRIEPQQAFTIGYSGTKRKNTVYQRIQATVWGETQRYQRRFQFPANSAKGQLTRNKIDGLFKKEKAKRARIAFQPLEPDVPQPTSTKPLTIAEQLKLAARFTNRGDRVIDKSTRRETQVKITRFNRFIDERQGEGAAPPSQRTRIKLLLMDAASDGESVTIINWICPPGTPLKLDSESGTLYRSFVGIDPEQGFNSDYRLADRLDRERALVKALDDSGAPYRYVKLVADDNAFCLYPAGLRVDGVQPTMDAVADFAAYAQRRLDTEIGPDKIEVMTVSQALGPQRFAQLVNTYQNTSIDDLLPFLPPNTIEIGLDVVNKHTKVDLELLPYFRQFVEDGIRQYGVEGSATFLDQVFGPRIILAWNESTRRTAIIDSLRKAQGFDPLPKIFTLYNKVNGQIDKNY